jgi:hypothetical protein
MLVTRQNILFLQNLSTAKDLVAVDAIPNVLLKILNYSSLEKHY